MGQKDYEKRVDKMENLPHNKTYVAKQMFQIKENLPCPQKQNLQKSKSWKQRCSL